MLRIAAVDAATTLLPIFAQDQGSASDLIFLYDTLVRIDPGYNVVPSLAKNWEISHDGLTYTFHLRRNAKWSDGQPITADDQVFEYQLTTNPATSAPSIGDYSAVVGVRAADAYTVVYKLRAPNAGFLAGVVGGLTHAPLPRHAYGKIAPAALKATDMTRRLVVSGSYTLKEWQRDDHMLLERNRLCWRGPPHIDEIYIKEYQSEAGTVIALQHGDVDTTFSLTAAQWFALKDDPRYTPIHQPADAFNFYMVNMKNPILAELAVRKAIMYAWDRKTEAERVFKGEDIPAVSPIPWALRWAFDPQTEKAYPFDPERAARILDAAGWKLAADGYRRKGGRLLQFTTGLVAGSATAVQSFEIFQANLRRVGIKTEATSLEQNVLYEKASQGDFDLDGASYGFPVDPDPSSFLSSKAMPPNGLNFGRYSDAAMDELIEQARAETVQAKRAALYRRLQRRFIEQLPILVDNMPYYRNVLSRRVRGFDAANAGSQFAWLMYHEPEWYIAQ